MNLKEKHCVPYDCAPRKASAAAQGNTPPLSGARLASGSLLNEEKIKKYSVETPGWAVVENKKISREFEFSAKGGSASGGKYSPFKKAIGFINKVAVIAEAESHHPDIYIFYNKVRLELSTHAIGGLSENDFILAAKINSLAET